MSGALKAGGVYVAVSAAIGELVKGVTQAIRVVEEGAKRIKDAAKGIAEVGTLFAAAMGGALGAAAQSNLAIRADLDKLKAYLVTLAADFGDAFAPFLHELVATVGSIVGAFQRLSPEVKAAAARFVVMGASVGAGAAILSKAAGGVEAVAKVAKMALVPALNGVSVAAKLLGMASQAAFPALGKAVAGMEGGVVKSLARVALGFGSVLLPVAAVAAAVAGIVLLAGALYEAWNDSSSGLKASVMEIWESIKGLGAQLMETLGGWFDALKDAVLKGLRTVLDGATFLVRKMAGMLAPLARGLQLDGLAATMEDLQKITADDVLNGLKMGASFLADKATSAAKTLVDGAKAVGKEVAEGVSTGLAYSTKGLKRIASDTGLDKLPGKLKAALGGVLGGTTGQVRSAYEPPEVSTVGQAGALPSSVREFQSGMSSAVRARVEYMKEEARKLANATAEAMRQARENLVQRFSSAFGDLSELISTFQQGLTAGGPAGAIAAVVADLLTRSAAFSQLVATLNGLVGSVADSLGTLVEPLIPLVGAVGLVAQQVVGAVLPALQGLAQNLGAVTPLVVMVGELLGGIGPVLAALAQASLMVQAPMQLLAGPVMKGLFEVLKFVSSVILRVVKGLGDAWNGIVGAVQAVFRKLADISVFGKHPLGFLDDWADGLNNAKVDTESMARALQALTGMTYEAAMEKAKETAEVMRNRKELERATESLSNVPNAWKVALNRFESQDGQQGPAMSVPVPTGPPSGPPWAGSTPSPWGGSGGTPTSPPSRTGGQGGGSIWDRVTDAVPMIGSIAINVQSPAEAVERLETLMDKLNRRTFGTRGRAGRYATEGG